MHKHYSSLYFIGLLGLAACAHPRSIVLSPSAPEGVRVYGLGEAAGAPDVARTQLGVDVRAASAEQAVAESSQRMAAVIAALKQLGIPDADLRTSQYALSFEPEHPQPQPVAAPAQAAAKPQPPAAEAKPRGHYRVTNTVTVTIRDLSKVGQVLQAAADADANSAYGINFDLDNDEALVVEARKRAIADAQHSAQELAKLTGVELGEVISITEEEPQTSGQPNTYALQSAAASVPVEEGEVTIRYGVQLVYATKRK